MLHFCTLSGQKLSPLFTTVIILNKISSPHQLNSKREKNYSSLNIFKKMNVDSNMDLKTGVLKMFCIKDVSLELGGRLNLAILRL